MPEKSSLSALQDELVEVLSRATKTARPNRVRAIEETVKALDLEFVFCRWCVRMFGHRNVERFNDHQLGEALAFIRAFASAQSDGGERQILPLVKPSRRR